MRSRRHIQGHNHTMTEHCCQKKQQTCFHCHGFIGKGSHLVCLVCITDSQKNSQEIQKYAKIVPESPRIFGNISFHPGAISMRTKMIVVVVVSLHTTNRKPQRLIKKLCGAVFDNEESRAESFKQLKHGSMVVLSTLTLKNSFWSGTKWKREKCCSKIKTPAVL